MATTFPEAIDYTVALRALRERDLQLESDDAVRDEQRQPGWKSPIGGAVAYKSGGAFTPLPNGVYDLATRTAGSATNAIVRTAVSFVAGRVYTIGARGDMTVTSTTATNRPFLDNTANR